MLWEETYAEVLTAAGFVRGRASPCCFRHPQRGISVVCHGDDFTALGSDEELSWYESVLAMAFELGDKTRLGHDPGDSKEVRILNRILRLDEGGLSYEADPRHVDLLARSLNLTQCRRIGTTGYKKPVDDDVQDDVPSADHDARSDQNSSENLHSFASPGCRT